MAAWSAERQRRVSEPEVEEKVIHKDEEIPLLWPGSSQDLDETPVCLLPGIAAAAPPVPSFRSERKKKKRRKEKKRKEGPFQFLQNLFLYSEREITPARPACQQSAPEGGESDP